jgi:hypothetical protein
MAWRSKKSDIKILRKTNRVEFEYKGAFYTYEFRSDSAAGFAFIFTSGQKIYGPFKTDTTPLGQEVHDALMKILHPTHPTKK